jgi:DNA repair protein RecO (recombination protein O)
MGTTAATEAIVLRQFEFSETSLVVHFFTRDFGRCHALARGARRFQRYQAGALDLLCVSRIVLRRKERGGLDLVTQATLLEPFPALKVRSANTWAAFYVAELLADVTQPGDPQPELYCRAVDALRSFRTDQPWRLRAHRFTWETITLIGHQPRLDSCARCGRAVASRGTQLRFCPVSGGLLCFQCQPQFGLGIVLDRRAVRVLQEFCDLHSDRWQRLRLNRRTDQQLWEVASVMIQTIGGQSPALVRRLREAFC